MLILLVSCRLLTPPSNGIINCGDGVPIPGETCAVTCDEGYHLMGSGMRTCMSTGRWNGSDATCIREWLLTYIMLTV